MFPLTVGVKDLGSLSFASTLAVAAICLFSFTVITNSFLVIVSSRGEELQAQLIQGPGEHVVLEGPFWAPKQGGVAMLRVIPLICFAYDMHL
jgi:hypothetical protein